MFAWRRNVPSRDLYRAGLCDTQIVAASAVADLGRITLQEQNAPVSRPAPAPVMGRVPCQTAGDLHLSVIIACHNYEDFVARSIESVLGQDDRRCELIVVDDGSTDGSWDVIQRYRVPKAFRIANGGALKACRYGLSHAAAPFVLFLDADDELAPDSLAEIIPRLDRDVAKLQFALLPVDDRGCALGAPFPILPEARERHSLQQLVLRTGAYRSPPTSGNVFRRDLCDLLAEVDYETSVDGVTLFMAPFFGDVVSLPRPLGRYRLHARNMSQAGSQPTATRFRSEAERFLVRHGHLRRLLAARSVSQPLVEGTSTFFYRERRFYQCLLETGRPRLREVVALQRLVFGAGGPMRQRLSLHLFFGLMLIASARRRRALLTYRIGLGHRTAWGLVRAAILPRALLS